MTNVMLKSKTTGLVGLYPESHLKIDSDLVLADEGEGVCVECVTPAYEAPEPVQDSVPELETYLPVIETPAELYGSTKRKSK